MGLQKSGGANYERDPLEGILGVISMDHFKIHKGKHWTANTGLTTLSLAGTLNMVLRVPAGASGHLIFEMANDAPFTGSLYENPTITGAGSALTEFNNYRASPNPASITAEKDATITAPGDGLRPIIIGAGPKGSGVGGSRAEFILSPSTNYLLLLTGTQNDVAYILAEWYELKWITS